jgi:6-phosphogluconolactonase
MNIFIGTYTGPSSQGIYLTQFDEQTGALSKPTLAGKTENPSYLILHRSGKFLYAVNENGMVAGKEAGGVSAFAVDPATDALTPINQQPSHGTYPCHLSIDKTGKCLMVANYGTGTFASYPLAGDGSIGPAASIIHDAGKGPNAQRQEGPHAHGIWPYPGVPTCVFACDLGDDRLNIFSLDPATATLKPAAPAFAALPPGTGPRHLAFGPAMYVVGELANDISVFTLADADAPGINPRLLQTISTLPAGFTGNNTAAELVVSSDGKFLYATNRGADDLVTYAIGDEGKLKLLAHIPAGGKGPRDFIIDPSGKWILVANQDSNSITTFAIDFATGLPKPVGTPLTITSPVCLQFTK